MHDQDDFSVGGDELMAYISIAVADVGCAVEEIALNEAFDNVEENAVAVGI